MNLEELKVLRHSTAHIMAQAVQDIFKDVQIAIGPAIEDGFYYDFDYAKSFTPEDLEKIDDRMREIIAADHAFQRREVSREDALAL
ncbi:MAG: threonine--tRNA ligase, partial [Thermodesulfobacteriota bacterium]